MVGTPGRASAWTDSQEIGWKPQQECVPRSPRWLWRRQRCTARRPPQPHRTRPGLRPHPARRVAAGHDGAGPPSGTCRRRRTAGRNGRCSPPMTRVPLGSSTTWACPCCSSVTRPPTSSTATTPPFRSPWRRCCRWCGRSRAGAPTRWSSRTCRSGPTRDRWSRRWPPRRAS